MIAGGNATLVVADLEAAIRFYVETLGFKLQVRHGDDRAEVDAGGGFAIALRRARAGEAKLGAGSISVGLTLNQPIAGVVEVLANRGVKFRGPVEDDGARKRARFEDPDGNELWLVELGVALS